VGNIVIGRAIGGLVKVRHCAYLYEWLDISDRGGEANAFFGQIKAAVDNYRHNRTHHDYLIRLAMAINSSWDASTAQYVEMYRYGLLTKEWHANRRKLIDQFIRNLKKEQALFAEFFYPGNQEYTDRFDWDLKQALSKDV
jgi:hypothetical protein